MSDKQHKTVEANQEARNLSHMIAFARRSKKEWDEYEKQAKERLLELADGDTDVVFKTYSGEVVATVDESNVRGTMNWKKFQEDHPDLDYDKYRGEARTTVTIRTTWIEHSTQNPNTA